MARGRLIALAVGGAVVLAGVAGIARAGSGGGAAGKAEYTTGSAFSTPSGTYVTVASTSFAPAAGPMLIRFSATGWVQDWSSGPAFAGKAYAALRARVLVNGSGVAPSGVVLFDNTGKIAVRSPRPTASSYEWATAAAGGATTVTVQVSNLHTFDMAQINQWTLAVQHP